LRPLRIFSSTWIFRIDLVARKRSVIFVENALELAVLAYTADAIQRLAASVFPQ